MGLYRDSVPPETVPLIRIRLTDQALNRQAVELWLGPVEIELVRRDTLRFIIILFTDEKIGLLDCRVR